MDIVTNKSLMFALVNENGDTIVDSITGKYLVEETPNTDETMTMHFGILEPERTMCAVPLGTSRRMELRISFSM